MKRVDERKRSNKWILPLAAGIMVVLAVIVVLFIPKGTDKGGCHPIMIDEDLVQYQGSDLKIDLDGLSAYEDLFSKVEDH